ncbi:hypothetical protein ACHAQH_003140 [Verticillium albo-atrum]
MDETPRNGDYVARIVKHLNANGVPCALWHSSAAQVYGHNGGFVGVYLVVPDDLAEKAAATLSTDPGLRVCQGKYAYGDDACHVLAYPKWNPGLIHHMHVQETLQTESRRVAGDVVQIFRQSQTLWALPPIPHEFTKPQRLTLRTSISSLMTSLRCPSEFRMKWEGRTTRGSTLSSFLKCTT